MSDQFTTSSHESWFSRMGNSIKGILFGFILFLGAFPLLFWNEGRSVETYKTLQEGGKQVVSLTTNSVTAENEGRLIHLSGSTETNAVLADPDFKVSSNAIKLIRRVEMYQWQESSQSETKKELGGGTTTQTTYSYRLGWSQQLVSSANFAQPQGHQNPHQMPYKNKQWVAKQVKLGDFSLSRSLIGQINNSTPLQLNELPESTNRQPVHPMANGFYLGQSPSQTQIGDMRITYAYVPTGNISIIAKQLKNTLQAYQAKAGGNIEILKIGIASAQDMFQQAQAENTMLTWILRVVGLLVMYFGLRMILSIISVTADVIPILGNIAEFGLGIIAFMIAAIFSLITIAIAWVFYRPLIGLGLITVAVGIIFWMKRGLKKAPTEIPAAAPPASAAPPPPPPPAP